MGNWKELGVVPDSEDEGWGSEDSQLSLTPNAKTSYTAPKPSNPQPDLRNDAVWDFHDSPEPPRSVGRPFNGNVGPTSGPRSTDSEHADQAASQLLGTSPSQLGGHRNKSGPARDSPDPLAYCTEGVPPSHEPLSRRDDIPPTFVQVTATPANPFSASSLDKPFDTGPRQYGPEKEKELGLTEHFRGRGLSSSTQSGFPAQGHRSLRPRKPIQEHPYLLENAQYSKLVKSHGVKPVRISAEERDALRHRNEADSQDHEYSAKESQMASGGPDGEPQERQDKARRGPLDDELDELALSQSPGTSSPQRHLRASSEQSPGEQTNATSISDEEEFPDIRDLTGTQMKRTSRVLKRRLPHAPSTSRKFPRTKPAISRRASPQQNQEDIWEFPPSPSHSNQRARLGSLFSPDVSPLRLSPTASARRSISPPLRISPALSSAAGPEAVDLTHLTWETEQEDEKTESPGSSSPQSDSEMIRKTGRRIRGVLPASWLRLDQQSRKETAPSPLRRRSPPRSPEQPRPGLAVRRLGASRPSVSNRSFLEDLDDGSDDHEYDRRHIDAQPGDDSGRLPVGDNGLASFDDAASVVEEDFVDWMLPAQKRHRPPMEGPPRKRKKLKQKVFQGEARQHYRQQKISASVRSLDSSRVTNSTKGRRAAGPSHRPISPPALSIVDFVEPGAPKFIKVAARAACRRENMGRSKPTNKSIHFGNRSDNIDALSVLTAWRTGRIKTSKLLRVPTQRTPSTARRPLRTLSANARHKFQPSVRLSFAQPQKVTRQISMRNFLPTGNPEKQNDGPPAEPAKSRRTKTHDRHGRSGYRSAQLEADVPEDLAARKKILDLVFRKGRKEVLAPTFRLRPHTPDQEVERPSPSVNPARRHGSELDVLGSENSGAVTNKTRVPRPRKLVPPRRLDLEAPQFKHANDPLPFFDAPADEEVVEAPRQGQNRIFGLGPFGTHYTQHFDIFPLHAATFFHQTTVIGNGTLRKAMCFEVSETIGYARPDTSFQFSGHTFSWRWWTDTTSSELGLVFDLLAEKLEESLVSAASTRGQEAIACVDHVLRFMLDSVSVDQVSDLSPFVQRSSELLLCFMDQTRPFLSAQHCQYTLVQVNARLLICALILLRFCQGTVGLSNEVQYVEDLLKCLAKVVIGQLVKIGLSEVRGAYDELQRLAPRERGIRNDAVVLICWVIVIKVLASAQMPGAGFWDLTGSAIAGYIHQTTDAHMLEASWRDMFTLLPLGEFDDGGILSKGLRYVAPLQGWALPQKLLKIVFESYESNQRQSPSFNDYCRALMGRCHYLLKHWGWHKCVGIVGTIFDFFGNQNLSHLRNEEVYKSPRFLEELYDGPCLSVEPEDRCFHIFLKMLAVAIQKMRQHGLTNDIRNLVARCLPNHNRQYSKEQTIHSHDLASLRNHHDLLCTLFWAVPPEDRRPVDLIEKLVLPATSHKEACLINLRAWGQLARFVVSSGGSVRDFRPFMSWQNNVFQQILNQYLSAAADVQHQFMSLAKEDRRDIQQQFLDSVVAANQAAAKDVLYCSVAASLDVIKHCPSLTSTMFAFNVSQTNKVFSKLIPVDKELDSAILRACFDTIDLFVKRVEDLWFQLRESSNDSIPSHGHREFEDAVEFLDDKIVQGFFAAVRRTILLPVDRAIPHHAPKSATIEKSISLCGRIASLFVNGGKTPLRLFFTAGKYGLFEALPQDLSLAERKFLPLFVATLLKNHIFNFSVIGCTHFDIWMLSLVKPYPALGYENHLAEILKTLDMRFMKRVTTNLGAVPDYTKNRDFFSSGISYMRNDIRKAEVVVRKSLRAKYEKVLRSVMQQMKTDIKSLILDSVEHRNYINFIRDIIGLIKSHGADICTVDPFYYQVSAEYSPAKEDPQLHTAGILAYGLRLGEGEVTAIPQLFHYLYNHFKSSLSTGRLEAESKIIENGMKDDNILAFVIGRMLPAITLASTQCPDIWPLLGVYSKSLRSVLERSAVPREIPECQIDDVLVFLGALISWVRNLVESSNDTTGMTPVQAHILTELMAICNALHPTLMCWIMQPSVDPTKRMWKCTREITLVAKHAAAVLNECAAGGGQTAVHDVRVTALLSPARGRSSLVAQPDSHVNSFAQNLTREVRHTWSVGPGAITVRVATTSSAQHSTQSLQGVKNDLDTRVGLFSELLSELRAWVDGMGNNDERRHASKRRRRRVRMAQGTMAL